jgi:hypothetical protein
MPGVVLECTLPETGVLVVADLWTLRVREVPKVEHGQQDDKTRSYFHLDSPFAWLGLACGSPGLKEVEKLPSQKRRRRFQILFTWIQRLKPVLSITYLAVNTLALLRDKLVDRPLRRPMPIQCERAQA